MDSLDQLISLLRRCTGRISTPSASGTGFFVAPGLMLTCAHVVGDSQSNQTPITVVWEGQTYHAKILRLTPSPYPDLALLKLEGILATHPCVFLHDAVRVHDTLYSYGYTQKYSHGDSASFVFEGITGGPEKLLKFKEGEAVEGFSGAPLFDLRTGCVCGVMSITRGQNTLMGGRGVPTSIVLEKFEELVALQEEFHHKDRHWYDLLPESEVKQFSWQELRTICSKITEQRMLSTVRDKYSQELYLQRDHAHQAFMRFLEDPTKRGFVLVGGSGVGKSNFLLAAREELQSREGVCMLMYDAGSPMEHPLMETLNEDFHEQVGWTTQRLWEKIKDIDGIGKRLVLFCVDALNEYEQPRPLLKQLNELIQRPWPWLKVVIVSRPEAWQSIKRGVKLAETLYYRGEGGTPGAILESFNYSEHLVPFARRDELPLVYAKYQQLYQVQTPYEDLSSRIRDIISDPFNLWFLTETHTNKTIPENLKATTLIEECVSALTKEGKLQGGDREWLENQLVPLMVSESHYERVITSVELDTADHAFYMALLDRVDHSGQLRLQSFKNMVDADILKRETHGLGFEISFKYERFYDFFIGRRIFHMSPIQADRSGFFLSLIGEIADKTYLWGAVRNALVDEAKRSGSETILKLCSMPPQPVQQSVKEMMVNVLITLGRDSLEPVEEILRHLIPQEKKVTAWRKGLQLLGKGTEEVDVAARSAARIAARIAIEAASNLRVPWVLQNAALQTDSTIRTEAVRYTYYLWQRDPNIGFEILEYLAEKATHGFIPNRIAALESTVGLTAIIFFEHSRDEAILRRLQSIWRRVIAKLLYIREGSLHGEGAARAFIRERLFSFVIKIAFRYLRELPAYNVISYQGLEAFFQLETTKKKLYRRLIQYLDVEGDYSREQMENDYLGVIQIDNLLLTLVAIMGLVAHACHNPLAFLPFLKKLFEEAKSDEAAYPHLTDITKIAENVLDRDPMVDEVFDFFVYTVGVCQQYYTRYKHALHNDFSKAPDALYLGSYALYQYQREGTVRTEWLETRIQAALSKPDTLFFDLLLTTELPLIGLEHQKPMIALDVLALFFNSSNTKIQSFLARLRVHYPNEVDDFLEEQDTPDAFRLQVQTNESAETIGALIGQRSWYFLRDEVLLSSPELRSELMRIFEKAADCKDARTWLDYFIREIINLIYGGEALHQSK